MSTNTQGNYIKWIDFNATAYTIDRAISLVNQYNAQHNDLDLYDVMAYISLKNANKFDRTEDTKILKSLEQNLKKDTNPIPQYKLNKYFDYYIQSYRAVLSGIIGTIAKDDNTVNTNQLGIIGYHPIAKGHWYNNYDDFGNSRSFGYKRLHLGNDMFGSIGAPIIAIEGGTVQELGWNRYGGWRIGIRSLDTKRFYYYAHLRNKTPYPPELSKGDTIQAGQVIGYLGNTGYGKIGTIMKGCNPHLHLGLQIIFDPSQEKGAKEIWVDVYQIVKLLNKHRATI
jgi:murein DD-endopeptidase MepM/ murein hydrolase activator NlpD